MRDKKIFRFHLNFIQISLFVGTWLDNLRDGVGIAIYPNGDRFEGIWRRGQRNGRGRYWFANSSDQPDSADSAEGTAELAGAATASCLQGVWVDDIFNAGTLTSTPIIQQEEYESNRLKEITNSGLSEPGVPEGPATAPQIFEDQLTLPQP